MGHAILPTPWVGKETGGGGGAARANLPARGRKPIKYGMALNPKTIRFSVIKDLYHIRKLPIEQVMIFSGHHWLTSIKKFALNDDPERVDDMNKFFPINKM